jgi:hypothetical protein
MPKVFKSPTCDLTDEELNEIATKVDLQPGLNLLPISVFAPRFVSLTEKVHSVPCTIFLRDDEHIAYISRMVAADLVDSKKANWVQTYLGMCYGEVYKAILQTADATEFGVNVIDIDVLSDSDLVAMSLQDDAFNQSSVFAVCDIFTNPNNQ